MRIGIDADGVLTDMYAFYIEYGKKYFNKEPTDPFGYSISDIFGCTQKEEFKFGLKYFVKYCTDCPPRENCAEIISKLNADGHRLYEITARKFVTMKNPLGWYSRKLFENWIKSYGMKFNDIYYCSESNSPRDKLIGCKKFNIDYMIDDKPEVAIYLANNGIKVLLFDTQYNAEVKGDNIIRVSDWKEIYRIIST